MTLDAELRGSNTAAAVAVACDQWEADGEFARAYRAFITLADSLRHVSPEAQLVLTAEPPADAAGRWGDAVAALVEYRLTAAGVEPPQWVAERHGDAEHPWEPRRDTFPIPWPVDLDAVAEPFLRRGILIEANELESG